MNTSNWLYEALDAVREASEPKPDEATPADTADVPAAKADPDPKPKAEPKPAADEKPARKNPARFMLFGGSNFYPAGGWGDYQSMHTSAGAALDAASSAASEWDWWQIVDLQSQTVIRRKGRKDIVTGEKE